MAILAAASRSSKVNPKTPSLRFFCSQNGDPPSPIPSPLPNRPLRRPSNKRAPAPEKIEDTINRMMASRAWTYRLQNSIRRLVPKFDSELVNNVLSRSRRPQDALQFFRWTERSRMVKHDLDSHRKIIGSLSRAGKLNHARCILLDMPEKGLDWDEDMFVDLILGYGYAGVVQESVKMFDNMAVLGVKRSVNSYDVLFKVILTRGRYMMAKRYFNKMLAEGIEPTVQTYNILIWGFFLSQRVKTAARFFQEMKSRGVSPDVVTYNTMIHGFFRGKSVEEAEKCFVEMKERELVPNVNTYTSMIKGYVSVGRVDDAQKCFDEMKGNGVQPTCTTFLTLLPGLCDDGKMPEARAAVEEMVAKGAKPKEKSIFMRLVTEQCKSGDVNAATDILRDMVNLDVPIEAGHYGVLIENFCKAGLYDQAVDLVDRVIAEEIVLKPENSFHMEPTAYNAIIDYLCNNGQATKAETLLRQLLKIGVQDSVAFNNLIAGHAKEGAPDSAYDLLKIMVRRKLPTEARAFESLIMCYLNKGEPADAKIAFESMIENGHSPDSPLYRSLMESLFEDGRIQTASRVMKTMLEKGVKAHMDLMSKILEALLMRGHCGEALGRVELLMQSGLTPDFNSLTSVLCENGKSSAALKLLDFCLERDYDVDISSYDKVLDALLAEGNNLTAYSILRKILAKGVVTDMSSAEQLIKSLNQEGNTKQADNISRMINKDKATDVSHGKKKKKAAAV